jgi:hypothetical protein
LDNSSGCSFSVDENKLVLRVSRSDFGIIKQHLADNQARGKRLTIIRIEITPENVKLKTVQKAVEQLTGSVLLRLESD